MVFEAHNLTISSPGTLSLIDRVPFLALKEKILGKSYDLSIAFVTPQKAQQLNVEHRDKDYVPNTLSFSLTQKSGEIILCMGAIKKEFRDFGMDLDTYITFLVIHSMLHLVGMEHGSTMEHKEKQLLAFFTTPSFNETNHRSRH